MDMEAIALAGLVGIAAGGLIMWRLIGDYYKIGPTEREKELFKQLAELQALLRVPPLFWHIWERYLQERSPSKNNDSDGRGKHAAPDTPEATDDSTPPRGERG
jgi:hypothetical protein